MIRVQFSKSFTRDLKSIRDRVLLQRIAQAIESTKSADRLEQVPNLTKLTGHGGAYRIRIGDHRLGVVADEGGVTFVRCLHRREVYRYFP